METPKPITGPYRATRLWNEAIRIFNNGVPRKRHWRQLRQYENCFTASEAVNWLHAQLKINPHFGPTVTKDQTQQLLCKFLKAGVFEDVRGLESKIEHFKENSGLYRLTNRSPFRNPRTPGRANPRTPLGSVPSRANHNEESGSPTLSRAKISMQSKSDAINPKRLNNAAVPSGRTLVHQLTKCQLTSRQLRQEEVEELWKSLTLKHAAAILGLTDLNEFIDSRQIKGKWILWNVTHIGSRGIVQSMEERDCPPPWVLYGMKSLVNWPTSDQHKLPEYAGSEKDVFRVICDYFTGMACPLTQFSLYNLFVEAFIRAEAHDVQINQSRDNEDDNDAASISSRDSVHSLVMKMASPMPSLQRRPPLYYESQSRMDHSTYPVVKSPLSWRVRSRPSCDYPSVGSLHSSVAQVKATNRLTAQNAPSSRQSSFSTSQLPLNACYETAFTSVEPQTRIIPQEEVDFLRRSKSSRRLASSSQKIKSVQSVQSFRLPGPKPVCGPVDHRRRGFAGGEKENLIFRSLDRLRSKSGGYVNLAAFGSADCLDRMDRTEENSQVWGYPQDYSATSSWMSETILNQQHSHSISSLSSCRVGVTGLSPSSFSDSVQVSRYDYENLREFSNLARTCSSAGNQSTQSRLRPVGSPLYQSSPSKRFIGRPKGPEFYYGVNACRPGLVTEEGKALAVESLQLLTLLLPPDQRRKLHLLLRFMSKVAANTQLVLDPEVSLKTLMINTFYRCIICSADEADYDELLAVRLVTFLMEHAESIMIVPHKLCTQVRDRLVELQREKIRFDPDDAVPLTYCRQVSPKQFEQQRRDESNQAVSQLLQHIIDDTKMSNKEKRKRLKQFREAYPDIYYTRFPTPESEARVINHADVPRPRKQPMFARIRSLRL